jgi:hypothetical protein
MLWQNFTSTRIQERSGSTRLVGRAFREPARDHARAGDRAWCVRYQSVPEALRWRRWAAARSLGPLNASRRGTSAYRPDLELRRQRHPQEDPPRHVLAPAACTAASNALQVRRFARRKSPANGLGMCRTAILDSNPEDSNARRRGPPASAPALSAAGPVRPSHSAMPHAKRARCRFLSVTGERWMRRQPSADSWRASGAEHSSLDLSRRVHDCYRSQKDLRLT